MPLPKGNGVQNPLNLILPIKSWLKFKELETVIHLKTRELFNSVVAIGTLHFGRFVDFKEHNQLDFFTEYDGTFTVYTNDFLKYLGPGFQWIERCCGRSRTVSIEKHVDEWGKWAADSELRGIQIEQRRAQRCVFHPNL
jgi:hypothetical protein